ncbi:FKBP-type peptidyl-prolyl cis-trans isomerase [Lunatibacter salilacus]|uniref:FKBP-type peptidyl-prolyl cis-trans isomerase n=1 Tax=Lunatibacter salilacus TaxID=2483804 RepID=UPI00131D0D5E|nr:FKBP-type peptidyl-prolyl cis-trans isomerase [Lunatibacter salilacus]
MKKITLKLLALLGVVFVFSCVSEEENLEVIFEQDKQKIEAFVADFDVEHRKETVGESGVVLLITETNDIGRLPVNRDTIMVDYTGYLLDGTVFDTSVRSIAEEEGMFNPNRPYEPFRIELGVSNVIVGWHIALSQLREGEKATVLIPSFYGYGRDGSGRIPGNTVLVFDLDVVSVTGPE